MKRKFRLVVAIWQPQGDINFLLDDKITEEIKAAIEQYNKRYNGFKELQLVDVTKSTIILELSLIVPEDSVVDVSRAIAYFSKQLYYNYGWNKYSKVAKRLFTVIEKKELTILPEAPSDEKKQAVYDRDSAVCQVLQKAPDTLIDSTLKEAKLKWLYATVEYINQEIKKLESEGIKVQKEDHC